MQARKLTLVEIGVGGLPSASPVAPRFSTWFTTAEDKIETTSQQITQLQTGVDGVNAKADANAAAIQGSPRRSLNRARNWRRRLRT